MKFLDNLRQNKFLEFEKFLPWSDEFDDEINKQFLLQIGIMWTKEVKEGKVFRVTLTNNENNTLI